MKIINKISAFLVILLIILIPIIIFILNSSTNKQIKENAADAQNYAKTASEKQAQLEKDYSEILNEIPGIVCIGSDLMASSGTVKTVFPSALQNKLTNENYKIPVTNLAVSGENTLTVLGRIGVVPFVIKDTVTIPAESDLIEINLKSKGNGPVWPLAVSADNANFNPVTINGLKGMIGGDSIKDPETGENKHYFLRSEDGEPFTIPAGSIVNTSSDDEYKDYVHIIWLGENENWNNFKDLADYIKQIIDSSGKNKERYLVMGLIKGSEEGMSEYDEIMIDYFGSHYVNVRKYLSEYDLNKTDLIFTNTDIEQQKKGIVPSCMLLESGNLNDTAYNLLTELVYNKLIANDCIKKPVN